MTVQEQFETNPTQDPAPPEEGLSQDYIEVKFIPDRETGSELVESDPDDEEVNPGVLEMSSLEEVKHKHKSYFSYQKLIL